ncbi:hypothetical protein BN946_scf184801.g18 [Trametes cinnabarina]|uniref:Uncharacterized protein n=1 Tax=Pycnoporus cinnabarinus TaxID=5643 RepID=A0A060S9E7_PYCCI|nr:hypothetical protein BN946_scf184801.g18 [Trametes cinnabarina]
MFSTPSAALVGCCFYYLLFAVLAPLPAAARFASITFSQVKQCGNFSVYFAGGKAPAALPLTLSILPVNGTPVFITLPNDAWNSTAETGAAITFLPLPAGTQFIASLDDANGQGTALVSDVLVVDPSDTNDTSCLPTDVAPFVPRFKVDGPLRQCESFSVEFDPAQGLSAPSVRGLTPLGASFMVNQTDASLNSSGTATYTMDTKRDAQVLFLFSDSTGYKETSTLLPVFGDVESSTSCIPMNPLVNAASLDSTSSTEHITPKIAVIVIAVCGGVVALIATAMVTWFVIHRRKMREEKFTKLNESKSAPDPEKQGSFRASPPPRILTSVTASPISPVNSRYDGLTNYLRNPPYATMGSALVTPTSPDPRDPFGEQTVGSILGSLSARESMSAVNALGATALGNNGSGRATPTARNNTPVNRSSAFDPSTERMPGTSPYFGRLAITPDNSLATNPDSVLRRPTSTQTGESVSSQEIDHILEMATIYGSQDMPEVPQPAVTAPATLRGSAYMAGRESRRNSGILSPRYSPGGTPTKTLSPGLIRSDSDVLSHSTSQSTLRLNRFREPPLAPLPSSPLPSPNVRPSFDVDGVPVRDSASGGLQVPYQSNLGRSISSATRSSAYSDDGNDLEGFTMLQPPARTAKR